MHTLTNFKNFGEASLDLFQPLTILLGRNGSGKTNLIEGVELLSTLARGTPLNEITEIGRDGLFQVRGGLRSCLRFGAKRMRLRLHDATIPFDGQEQDIDYVMEMSPYGKHGVQFSREKLIIGSRTFYDAKNTIGELFEIKFDNFSRGRNPSCQNSATRSVLSRYEEIVRKSRADRKRLEDAESTVDGVRVYLRRSYIFDPQPKAMREYERAEPNPRLLRGGDNLSAVLFALKIGNEEQQGILQRITTTIRQIPEEPFVSIDFAETSLGDVMVGFVSQRGNGLNGVNLIDARLLSDGTLRMLAVVTALETVPEQSRIIIEEFDNGLHPSRASLLVQQFADAAERRKLNILVTTHNPAFMNAINEAQMDNVLLCHRDESLHASRVTRLGDLDVARTLALRGGLGDFVTTGRLEQHLKPEFTEKRAEMTREWLESLF